MYRNFLTMAALAAAAGWSAQVSAQFPTALPAPVAAPYTVPTQSIVTTPSAGRPVGPVVAPGTQTFTVQYVPAVPRFSRVWSSRCSDDGDPSASHPADGRQHYGDFSTADVCNDDDARPCRASTLPGHKHRQSTGSDDPAEHSGLHAELLLLLLSKAVPGTSRTGGPRGELSSGPRCSHSACRDQRVQRSLHRSVRTDVYRSRRNGPRPLSVLQLSSPLVLGWPARLQRDNSRAGLVTEPALLSHPEIVAVPVVENVTNKEHRSLGRQLLTESLLLAGISGLLGIVPVVWVSTSWRR